MRDSTDLLAAQRAADSAWLTAGADRIRLFCLPHAGGNAARFAGWSSWLPQRAEAVPVDLPGHGRRLREPLVRTWQPLVDDLAAIIGDRAGDRYAVFGHSLGALLAYDVCRALHDQGRPPALLVVAGRNGPSAGASHRPLHALPDEQFLAALRHLGGTPGGIDEEPELLQMFLPVIRADMRLAELYARPPGPPLTCPIAAFAGRHDKLTDGVGLLAWGRETTAAFELAVLDSGHFFLAEPEFTRTLTARLLRLP